MVDISKNLRRLYTELAVSGGQRTARFRKVRDAVCKDADSYVFNGLPHAKSVLVGVTDFFDNYKALEFEDWQDDWQYILNKLKDFEKDSSRLARMHDNVIHSLNIRQKEFNTVLGEMERLTEQKNMQTARTAIDLSKDKIIPSIEGFLTGLSECEIFFAKMRRRLMELGHPAQANEETSWQIRQHFDIMKKHAADVSALCSGFFVAVIEVRENSEKKEINTLKI